MNQVDQWVHSLIDLVTKAPSHPGTPKIEQTRASQMIPMHSLGQGSPARGTPATALPRSAGPASRQRHKPWRCSWTILTPSTARTSTGSSATYPPNVTQIAESLGTPHATSPFGGFQAPTASGDLDYSGPCPPDGELHSYQFHVDALDQALDLPQFAPRQDVLAAIEGAIIGHGQFEAGFRRVSRFEENVVFKITPEP